MRFFTIFAGVAALATFASATGGPTDSQPQSSSNPQTGTPQSSSFGPGTQSGDPNTPQSGPPVQTTPQTIPQAGPPVQNTPQGIPQPGGSFPFVAGPPTVLVGGSFIQAGGSATIQTGGYGYEAVQISGGYGEGYKIPHFEYPPLSDRIREDMRRFGSALKGFFHKIGGFFKKVGHFLSKIGRKIKRGAKKLFLGAGRVAEDVFEGIDDGFNCLAANLHVQFRKCNSDWERVKFWASCDIAHFKHWYEYRRLVREGKRRIYSRYQHDMLCTMAKYEIEMKVEYQMRVKACANVKDVYTEIDVVYMELVGNGDCKAPYSADQ